MIAFILIYLCQCRHKKSNDSSETYSKCIEVLKQHMPLERKSQEAKELLQKYNEAFDNNAPNSKQKNKICKDYEDTFINVIRFLLQDLDINDKIKERNMLRCIKKNLQVFAYTILRMQEHFPTEFERIKFDFLNRNDNNNFILFDNDDLYENDEINDFDL